MILDREPDFMALEKNIMDVIKEEQIKLGYRSETIRLYYPIDSILKLLGVEVNESELMILLHQFSSYVVDRLGKVTHSHKESRYCFVIPADGVTYVHEQVQESKFLVEFLQNINEHHTTLEEIQGIFQRYSDHVVCKKADHGEFDYLIYFSDGIPDSYLYCIKFEHGHAIYHRFTKNDYESFEFE